MQNSNPRLNAALEEAYNAVIDASLWPSILSRIADATHSYGINIMPMSGRSSSNVLYTNVFEDMHEAYFSEGWHAKDWHLRSIPFLLRRGVARDIEYTRHDSFKDHSYFRFCAKYGLGHSSIFEWHIEENDRLGMAFYRKTGGEYFSLDDLSMLLAIRSRIMAVSAIIRGTAEAKVLGVASGLELSGTPAIFFGRMGRITHVNALAERLLGGELHVSRGELWSKRDTETRRIREQIRFALASDLSPSARKEQAVRIERDGRRPFFLRILRLRGNLPDIFSHSEGVILFDAPQHSPGVEDVYDVLKEQFRLTGNEVEIVRSICVGMSLHDVASEKKRSYETVRTQLKSIFRKVEVTRQAELVAFVASLK